VESIDIEIVEATPTSRPATAKTTGSETLGRPSPETAKAICDLLGTRPAPLWRKRPRKDAETREVTNRQAFVVAVDVAMLAAGSNRWFTQNQLVDAIAALWSPTYRERVAQDVATAMQEMKLSTQRRIWSELQKQSINVLDIWDKISKGLAELYEPYRPTLHAHKLSAFLLKQELAKYPAKVFETQKRTDFLGIINRDPEYSIYRRVPGEGHALRADDVVPPRRRAHGDVAAEWKFNVVEEPGQSGQQNIEYLEAARTILNDEEVVRDLHILTPGEIPRLFTIDATTTGSHPNAVGTAESTVLLKTTYRTTTSGRFQHEYYWPVEVTRDHDRRDRYFLAGDGERYAGVDISSCQQFITAILTNNTEREKALTEKSAKQITAEEAWAKFQHGILSFREHPNIRPYEGPYDERLIEMCKYVLMVSEYGSLPPQILYTLRHEDPNKFGPGPTSSEDVRRLLGPMPLLEVCRAIADRAYARDKYAGVTFTHPYFGTRMRWNPVRTRTVSEQFGWPKKKGGWGRFKLKRTEPVGTPNPAGDYPVVRQKLRNKVPSGFVHSLDGALCNLVLDGVRERGVENVVSIHDGWRVPASKLPLLKEGIGAAAEPWLKSLRVVYNDLERHLDSEKDQVHLANVRAWRTAWERRVAEKRWPVFRVKAE
jgi:hypothetical protein